MSTGFEAQQAFSSAAIAAGISDPIRMTILDAMNTHDRAASNVLTYAKTVADRAAGAVKSVEAGHHLSANGELQSAALSFDIACSTYETTSRSMMTLVQLLPSEHQEALLALMFGESA